jgi:ABC-type amino acid transport system permease subunit
MSEQEFRPLESYTVAAIVFIALLVALAFLSTRLERQLRRAD